MGKIRYLTVEEAELLHDRILDLTGGERGDLARANLEFVLERVKDVGEKLDRNKAVVKKGAFLLYSLVTHHPFINGNKRTAFEMVDAFLELNGYVLRAKPDEIYSILSDLGAGRSSETQVEAWIATNLAKKKPETKGRIMTQQPRKKRGVEAKIGKEFRKIVEKNLRRDRELLEKLAKI